MSFSKEEYLEIFIDHFIEFVTDIAYIFPEDNKVQLLKGGLLLAAEFDKEKCINAWNNYVIKNFRNEINQNNYDFFIEKDWSAIITHKYRDAILLKINELRESVRLLSKTNKLKALKYVENLVKICDLYNSVTSI